MTHQVQQWWVFCCSETQNDSSIFTSSVDLVCSDPVWEKNITLRQFVIVDKWKRMKVDKCIEIINAALEMLNNKLVGIVLMTMNEVLPDLHSQGSPLTP